MTQHKENKPFIINDSFLLQNETSRRLYHDFASQMPIIDYHNHLSPQQIAENERFENITQVWLYGDHYKWRAMRALGVAEDYITGQKSDEEKFMKWASSVPYTLRNPLYHWTHLELKRYFGVETYLDEKSGRDIYAHCNDLLQKPSHSVTGLLSMMNVEVVCTTDDPTDDLAFHLQFKNQGNKTLKVFPSYRPDKFIHIEQDSFLPFLQKLEEVCNKEIVSFDDLIAALYERAEFFQEMGCRASDHGLEYISSVTFTHNEVDVIFQKRKKGQIPDNLETEKYKSAILLELGKMYHKLGWAQQFHLGALRNNNRRAMRNLGADTGWDSIGDWSQAKNLSTFLATLDEADQLAKSILYNLNPADNELMASMIGNFNDGSLKGKIQFGSAWWFLDQKDGMEKQINSLSNLGMLSCFIGMVTDSRSFLSFPRHEYFRRIICQLFGNEIEKGELPNDIEWIGKIIQDICYYNVREYLHL